MKLHEVTGDGAHVDNNTIKREVGERLSTLDSIKRVNQTLEKLDLPKLSIVWEQPDSLIIQLPIKSRPFLFHLHNEPNKLKHFDNKNIPHDMSDFEFAISIIFKSYGIGFATAKYRRGGNHQSGTGDYTYRDVYTTNVVIKYINLELSNLEKALNETDRT